MAAQSYLVCLLLEIIIINSVSGGDPACISLPTNPKYRGQVNITRSGRICQRWVDQNPHSHDVTTAEVLPDTTLEEASNFCRTPSNSPNKEPWCFTIDPAVRWEPCAFETRICHDPNMEKAEILIKNTHTKSGIPCQRWDNQTPHKHKFNTSTRFPDASLEDAGAFCRSPDVVGDYELLWCYTNNPGTRWEHCEVEILQQDMNIDCVAIHNLAEYDGTAKADYMGWKCARWDTINFPGIKPASLSQYGNRCGGQFIRERRWPWCVTENKRISYCKIPDDVPCVGPWCFDYPRPYSGRVNVTVTGLPCQRWDSLPTTWAHLYGTPWEFPDTDVHAAENYCRNPDGDIWPWCFTGDPVMPFDFCSVEDLVCHPDENISTDAVEISTLSDLVSESHTPDSSNASVSPRFILLMPLTIFSYGLYLCATI